MSEKDKDFSQGNQSKEISRRQFLTYTLMGVGGFLASTIMVPMVRFAIDPVLKAKGEKGGMAPVVDVKEITDVPKSYTFNLKLDDGWVKGTETTFTAWVYKEGDKIVALNPTCKHMGCMVSWEGSPDHPNHFFCPCHFGLYTKDGTNVPGTPPKGPLDTYEQEVKDGKLYLGRVVPRT
jgi:menaquinol-cytochrome c reductase iron-sulfur subunit